MRAQPVRHEVVTYVLRSITYVSGPDTILDWRKE
jgi:hypothetical protein